MSTLLLLVAMLVGALIVSVLATLIGATKPHVSILHLSADRLLYMTWGIVIWLLWRMV